MPVSGAGLPPVVGSPVRIWMMLLTPRTVSPRLYACSKVPPHAVSHALTWSHAGPPGGVTPAIVTMPTEYCPAEGPMLPDGPCCVNANGSGATFGLSGSTGAQYRASEKVVPTGAFNAMTDLA